MGLCKSQTGNKTSGKDFSTLRMNQPGSVSIPWPVLVFPESPKVCNLVMMELE